MNVQVTGVGPNVLFNALTTSSESELGDIKQAKPVSCSNDCPATECYTVLPLESSSNNIPS